MKQPLHFFLTISFALLATFQVNAQTSVFNWDVDNAYYIQPIDVGTFNINYYDEDGLTPDAGIGLAPGSYDIIDDGSGSNDILVATSWFVPTGQADNWIVFGPITHPTNVTSVFSWEHLMISNNFRDGYEVLVTNVGPTPANFGGATVIKSYADNDPLTDGNTSWTPQSANIPAGFMGGSVYIAIHHNANNQYAFGIDNFDVTQTTGSAPTTDFSANFTTILAGSSVDFIDLSTDTPSVWSWTFTGASTPTSTLQNPTSIVYPTAGCYEVSLTSTNVFGSDTETKTCYINVGNAPVADFSANSTTILAGGSVDFTDLSTNTPASWSWVFTGASTPTSSTQNPTSIVYPTAGCYEVSLTSTNGFGNDTETKTCYINVGNAPVADFSGSATSINTGGSVNFTDLSTNTPTSWSWVFTGASTPTSSAQNPTNIVYPTAGCYEVSLTSANAFGNDTETKTCYIDVTVGGSAPVADFSGSSTSITAGGSVDFTDLSTNAPTSWAWTFTGASTASSSSQHPSNIVYPSMGCYEVELTATNAFGSDTETKTCYIDVTCPAISAGFTWVNDQVGSIQFTNTSTGMESYLWDFGDTQTSTAVDPSHTYTIMGTYTVTLTGTDSDCSGSTDVSTQSITVTDTTTAISEFEQLYNLSSYPNPNNGQFTVELDVNSSETVQLRVLNVLGEEIKIEDFGKVNGQFSSKVDLGAMPVGIYLVEVTIGGASHTNRIVIR